MALIASGSHMVVPTSNAQAASCSARWHCAPKQASVLPHPNCSPTAKQLQKKLAKHSPQLLWIYERALMVRVLHDELEIHMIDCMQATYHDSSPYLQVAPMRDADAQISPEKSGLVSGQSGELVFTYGQDPWTVGSGSGQSISSSQFHTRSLQSH